MAKNDQDNDSKLNLLAQMDKADRELQQKANDLISTPSDVKDEGQIESQIEKAVLEMEQEVLSFASLSQISLQAARDVVLKFRPVPWFIWRLVNFVLGKSGKIQPVSEGLVMGLRRLLLALANDEQLGSGQKISDHRAALKVVAPDVVASVAAIYAICRRLNSFEHQRIFRPILDDALLRARIGILVAERVPEFGIGRGIMAGLASRIGLVVQIATGNAEQAQKTLDQLAQGASVQKIGEQLYGSDPVQVSAMVLSAAGFGRDAVLGIVSFQGLSQANPGTRSRKITTTENDEQLRWLAAFNVIEALRTSKMDQLLNEHLTILNYRSPESLKDLIEASRSLTRLGHRWNWILA